MFAQHISWKIENRERQKDMLRDTAPPHVNRTLCVYTAGPYIYIQNLNPEPPKTFVQF